MNKEQEAARIQAEQERQQGLDSKDAAARWLKDPRNLRGTEARWRTLPVTPTQVRFLRDRGFNPFLFRTRGEAADALSKGRRKKRR